MGCLQEKIHWYLHVPTLTWITKPYLFEENESKEDVNLKMDNIWKVKLKHLHYIYRKNWKKISTGTRWRN